MKESFHEHEKLQCLLAAAAMFVSGAAGAQDKAAASGWQQEFAISSCNLVTQGKNTYFVLEPGFQLVLEGGDTKLQITVLDETNGRRDRDARRRGTRVEEGELHEVSRNYFAVCEQTKDMFYFGEDVDCCKNGKMVSTTAPGMRASTATRPA